MDLHIKNSRSKGERMKGTGMKGERTIEIEVMILTHIAGVCP